MPPENDRWFAELTNKKLRRSTHTSVRARSNADIRTWIETWNDDPRPYVWTKTADQIVDSIATYCDRINHSRTLGRAARQVGQTSGSRQVLPSSKRR
jgi:hypothetical protein